MTETLTPEDMTRLVELLKAVRTAAEYLSEENSENTCDDPTLLFDAVTETAVQLRKLVTGMASETCQYFMRELELTPEWLEQRFADKHRARRAANDD